MRSIGFPELLVVLGVAVLLFGGTKGMGAATVSPSAAFN